MFNLFQETIILPNLRAYKLTVLNKIEASWSSCSFLPKISLFYSLIYQSIYPAVISNECAHKTIWPVHTLDDCRDDFTVKRSHRDSLDQTWLEKKTNRGQSTLSAGSPKARFASQGKTKYNKKYGWCIQLLWHVCGCQVSAVEAHNIR